MKCVIASTAEVLADPVTRSFFQRKLCKPASVFQQALFDGREIPGSIAVVTDQGEMIGWARTESWLEHSGESWLAGDLVPRWDTLEAFVATPWRGRGVASFAAAGLVAARWVEGDNTAAVFHPYMMLLARRVGLHPVLFREEKGKWVRA